MEQFDNKIGKRVGPAQKGVALLLLVVGQRERRVALEIYLALDQKRLARRALPLLAPVREHDPLPKRALEDRLVLGDLDLDVDWFEADSVPLAHAPPQPG